MLLATLLKSEITELEPKIMSVGNLSIGIYKFRGKFYAYLNRCPHQGGPACEGKVLGKTIRELDERGNRVRDYDSEDRLNILCPWHGFDYDLQTGLSSNNKLRLRKYTVIDNGDTISIES